MKRSLSVFAALCLLLGALALGGCEVKIEVPSETSSSSVLDITVLQHVSGTDIPPVVQQDVPALADIPARKLMQVDYTKVYRYAPQSIKVHYAGAGDSGTEYSRADTVPQKVIDTFGASVVNGDIGPVVSAHGIGTELSADQLTDRLGVTLTEDPMSTASGILADADNDGIDDIVALVFYGGTGGFSELKFFKGSADGFRQTDSLSCINYNYYILSFDGKNYVCQYEMDYNTKYVLGCCIYSCKDGRFTDGVSAIREVGDYNVSVVYEDMNFAEIDTVRKTLVNKKMPEILDAHDGVIFGTAEDVIEEFFHFSGDIDNDGSKEYYYKKMFYPSNTGTWKSCLWEWLDENDEYLNIPYSEDIIQNIKDADTSLADTVYTFWLDKVGNTNVLYLYTDSADRFTLSAYIVGK